jgi:serine/threonine-protein kinase
MDFMSPEQAKGQPVTFRSDLYSLGTLMFTLLSGKPPFSANSVEESLRNLTRVPAPRISSVVPDVPPELDGLIRKLMSKKPEKRIQTAQALIYKIEEAEALLLSSSQAKTSEINQEDVREETFDVPQPSDVATQVNTEKPNKKNKSSTNAAAKNHDPTVDHTAERQQKGGTSDSTKVDYFNTVADQVRHVQSSEDSEVEVENVRGMLPLILGLLAVLGLGIFGIYQAYRPPSAESLYSTIDASVERPNIVMDEIDQFISLYPDDPRFESVEELQHIGSAIQHYNRLTNKLKIRSNIAGEDRLTEVESQFLEIVELGKDEPETALAKMAALITVHENDPELSERDQACLKAVDGFRVKIVSDSRTQLMKTLNKIRAAMKAAANQDSAQAIPVYRSILELYQDVEWGRTTEGLEGRRLVAKAKATLQELLSKPIGIKKKPENSDDKQAKKETDEPQSSPDEGSPVADEDDGQD